jgi:hypothetical protein
MPRSTKPKPARTRWLVERDRPIIGAAAGTVRMSEAVQDWSIMDAFGAIRADPDVVMAPLVNNQCDL